MIVKEQTLRGAPIVIDRNFLGASQKNGNPRLSVFVGALLLHADSDITDIYVAADEPVVVRLAASKWVPVVDDEGAPWRFGLHSVQAFVSGIYSGDEVESVSSVWREMLSRYGSLHPATVLSGKMADGRTFSARVRCAIQRQTMGTSIGLVLRILRNDILSPEELGLPTGIGSRILNVPNGLVVVTGPTGSGKSTTLASFIETINQHRTSHIITIEDPIEYEFIPGRGIITQREIGIDTPDFSSGIKDALRFVPDVILVGEIRDEETMRAVIRAAESGHLVFTSMHAPTVNAAILKMRALLASSDADIWALANNLQMVIAQALIHSDVMGKNVLLYEILPCQERVVQQYVVSAKYEDWQIIHNRMNQRQMPPPAVSWSARAKELLQKGMISQRVAMRFEA